MNVLVTGATGFFGSGIVAQLVGSGHEVSGAARGESEEPHYHPLDVTAAARCGHVLRAVRPSAVVHAAGLAHVGRSRVSTELYRRVNCDGTANVLDAAIACGARRFVFISSVLVYGEADLPAVVRESDAILPADVYARSKAAAETVCAARAGEIEVVILRMSSMYSREWLFNIRRRVRPMPLVPVCVLVDPSARRYSFCSRRNGAEVVRAAVEGRIAPGAYNVADRYVYSQREIRAAVQSVDGRRPCLRLPLGLPSALAGAARLAPSANLRSRARALYWKFCRPNVYSTEKLEDRGLDLSPELLAMVGRR